ncbi:MAG: hypothetical protein M3441_08815 [Chloroflexota bacterium]|nr:hypothetical protein [Chloroflexota bacterium]
MGPEWLTLIVNTLLAVLTGVYVIVTYALVKESRRANDLNRSVTEKQLRLLTLPQLFCELTNDTRNGKTSLIISNVGNVPAFDIDIYALGAYHEDDMDIPTFMLSYAPPKYRKEPLNANDEGFYHVRDHIIYYLFPLRKRITVELLMPTVPHFMYILLQYKELLGANYVQVYYFGMGDGTYRLVKLAPPLPTLSERIDYKYESKQLLLQTENGSSLPAFLEEEFTDSFAHSIPAGFLIAGLPTTEDRGIWQDL